MFLDCHDSRSSAFSSSLIARSLLPAEHALKQKEKVLTVTKTVFAVLLYFTYIIL